LVGGPKWIINFPTKKHWRNPSKIDWIKDVRDEAANGLAERMADEGSHAFELAGENDRCFGVLRLYWPQALPGRAFFSPSKKNLRACKKQKEQPAKVSPGFPQHKGGTQRCLLTF
jgi:hypothetical protein